MAVQLQKTFVCFIGLIGLLLALSCDTCRKVYITGNGSELIEQALTNTTNSTSNTSNTSDVSNKTRRAAPRKGKGSKGAGGKGAGDNDIDAGGKEAGGKDKGGDGGADAMGWLQTAINVMLTFFSVMGDEIKGFFSSKDKSSDICGNTVTETCTGENVCLIGDVAITMKGSYDNQTIDVLLQESFRSCHPPGMDCAAIEDGMSDKVEGVTFKFASCMIKNSSWAGRTMYSGVLVAAVVALRVF